MEEGAVHVAAKGNITDNLKSAVHLLQRRYVCSDTPIYSDDTANAVCNIMEAIFLHELKSFASSKLSSYFSGTDVNPQPNFWQFLMKFTHRDVLSQLNHLGRITTHIGLCRAWIRLALNDGVLESYMDAILGDKETLRHFYKTTAYLRDSEHPLIMNTYIQGMNSFQFALSYNSSVLNVWTSTPLALAARLFTRPLVMTATCALQDDEEAAAEEDILDPDADHIVVPHHRHHRLSRTSSHPFTPHNTPLAGLSRANIDEIRSTLRGAFSVAPGSGSSTPTSQISHPDPVDARLQHMDWVVGGRTENEYDEGQMTDDDKVDVINEEAESVVTQTDQLLIYNDHDNDDQIADTTPSVPSSTELSPFLMPASSPGKSEVLPPEMSDVTASCESFEEVEGLQYGGGGNSLALKQGWSSEFYANVFGPDSFDSLLQNYGPSKPMDVPTIGDVINSLPDSGYGRSQRLDVIEITVGREVDQDDSGVSETATGSQLSLLPPSVEPLVSIFGDICNERGLDVQNYLCNACSRPVGIFYGKARVCTYDACYYCYECHENEEYYIPSRILHNWDFRKHKVCHQNMKLLHQYQDQPLIDVEKKHPRLYERVIDMNTIKNLRIQLRLLKAYLFSCKQDVADGFREQFTSCEYLYESIHLYSLNDFLKVHSGQLKQILMKIIRHATSHVYHCALCQQKGFICEICKSGKVIYPFENANIYRCMQCQAVYHSDCKTADVSCPKCERRQSRSHYHANYLDDDDDYACSP